MKTILASIAAAGVLVAGAFVAGAITDSPAAAQVPDAAVTDDGERVGPLDEVMEGLVADGTLTQDQADEVEARLRAAHEEVRAERQERREERQPRGAQAAGQDAPREAEALLMKLEEIRGKDSRELRTDILDLHKELFELRCAPRPRRSATARAFARSGAPSRRSTRSCASARSPMRPRPSKQVTTSHV